MSNKTKGFVALFGVIAGILIVETAILFFMFGNAS